MGKDRVETGRGRRPGVVKKGRSSQFFIVLAVVAAAGIGLLAWLATRPKGQVVQFDSTLPAVVSEGYVMGNPAAPVEVVEFADFECPSCERFATLTEPDVRERLIRQGTIRYRFIDFPLSMHRNTWNASRAAACANEQGRFWEMHDAIFNAQDRWNSEATGRPDPVLRSLAEGIGLNMQQYDACIVNPTTQAKVQAHLRLGERAQISATPSFVIGGKLISGAMTYDEFKARVDSAVTHARASGATPRRDTAATKAPATPR